MLQSGAGKTIKLIPDKKSSDKGKANAMGAEAATLACAGGSNGVGVVRVGLWGREWRDLPVGTAMKVARQD